MELFETTLFFWLALATIVASGAALLLLRDRRAQVAIIFIIFLVSILVFISTLPSYLVLAKAITAIIVALMFFATAWQVHWIETPELSSAIESGTMSIQAVNPDELPVIEDAAGGQTFTMPDHERQSWFAAPQLSTLIFRSLIVVFLTIVAIRVARFDATASMLGLDASIMSISFVMIALGIAVVGLTEAPFRAGLGMIMLLTGFDLVYATLQPSLAVVALLAVVNISVALGSGYLTLVRAERFLETADF